MDSLINFIIYVIELYKWVVIAGVILSWLITFNVVNIHNPFVRSLWEALNKMTEPVLRPIRRMLPDLGGLDISPIILFLGLIFLQSVVLDDWVRSLGRGLRA
jgi:YggT family protein